MRILVLTELYPPFYKGGYELRCKETVDEIARRGHNVFVLTSRWGIDREIHEEKIYRLLYINPLGGLLHRQNPSTPLHLDRRFGQIEWAILGRRNYLISHDVIDSVKPDLIYVWNMMNVGISPIQAAQDKSIPTVYSLGDDWLSALRNELYNDPSKLKKEVRRVVAGIRSFHSMDFRYLMAVSQSLKREYVESGFLEQNITVIPRGIPEERILGKIDQSCTSTKSSFRLLFVGRLSSEKGPDDAIRVLGILRRDYGLQNIELDIVGTGADEYQEELKRLIAELKLDDHVEFHGQLEHQVILDRYSSYEALLFPSRWEEPIGTTILEAMSQGLPVVATNRGGTTELIRNDVNGIIVEADDPDGMAEAVHRILSEEGLAARLKSAGLDTIRNRFTLEGIVDRILLYFQNVLDDSNRIKN